MRLSSKIALVIVLTLAVIGLVTGSLMLYFQMKASRAQYERMAENLAAVMQNQVEHEMKELQMWPMHVQERAMEVAQLPGVNEVVIYDASGSIFASAEAEEVGEYLRDPELMQVLETGLPISRTETRYGVPELCVIRPLLNRPECQACHGPEPAVLGAVELGLDMAPLQAATREQALILLAMGGLTFLGVGVVLTIALRRTVLDRLSRLATAARRMSSGDYSSRVRADSQDEVGMVARAFNEMAQQVERTTAELEQRVQQRTRELSAMVRVITVINSHLDLDRMLDEALKTVAEVSEGDAVAIFLSNGKNGGQHLRAHYGLSPEEAARVSGQAGAGEAGGEPKVDSFSTQASTPLRVMDRVLGWMVVLRHQPHPFPPEFTSFLRAVAEPMSVAIEKSRLYLQVQQRDQARGELLRQLVSAQEEERKRVAREIHDEWGQKLTVLMGSISQAEADLPRGSRGLARRLRQAWELAQGALNDMRKLIAELRPEVLDDLGLVPALRLYVKDRLEPLGIAVHLEHRGLDRRLPPLVELSLFRVLQEAVTNIARHAQASSALVRLEREDATLFALVEDDGQGFEVRQVRQAGGNWGTKGMEERITQLGGSLTIDSAPGRGTRVRIRLPLGE